MADTENLVDLRPGDKLSEKALYASVGTTGLGRFGGWVQDELLPELWGRRWRTTVREMLRDPTLGSALFAIEMLSRQVDWHVDPADDSSEAEDIADFCEGCLHDMSRSWGDTLAEFLSMLPFGFSYNEIVYKIRKGPGQDDPKLRSKFDDGKIGWRKIEIRAQETLDHWEFDGTGGVQGMWQFGPPDWKLHYVPIDKSLLFRTKAHKNNPEGQALAPETPVPTPDGWRLHGELQPGDRVFDETGAVRRVVDTRHWRKRPRYKVTFADGTHIIADAEHLWETNTPRRRHWKRPEQVVRTEAVAIQTRRPRWRMDACLDNHSIGRAQTLQYETQDLLIEPYLFGQWLGDGDANELVLSTHVEDAGWLQRAVGANWVVRDSAQNGARVGFGHLYRTELRQLGVWKNKHIPVAYLIGDPEQRLATLQGLMDSDGTVDANGRIQFDNTNRRLIDGVAELARSLECGVRIQPRQPANAKSQPAWRVSLSCPPGVNPFRLPRKRLRVKAKVQRQRHYIVSVDRIEDGPTGCIQTDAPSHLYLAGESMVPTHNSLFYSPYRPWYFKRNIENFEGIGIERDLAGLPVMRVPGEILAPDATAEQVAQRLNCEKIVRRIRRDEEEGVLIPGDRSDAGHLLYELYLLSTGGQRQHNLDGVLQRKAMEMLMCFLADFMLVGHEKVGSFALSTSKINLFTTALGTFLDSIAEIVNEHGFTRLLQLNQMDVKLRPELKHGNIEPRDLVELGTFLLNLSQAGAPIFPNQELVSYLMDQAGLPAPPEQPEGEGNPDQPVPIVGPLARPPAGPPGVAGGPPGPGMAPPGQPAASGPAGAPARLTGVPDDLPPLPAFRAPGNGQPRPPARTPRGR